mmetsp:Transcript_2565/g.10733  ORF Transcript_2565/g.10733 Transcript_2565/m.10733 type:complete len:268 (+) Transcript_2565:52-855(+)
MQNAALGGRNLGLASCDSRRLRTSSALHRGAGEAGEAAGHAGEGHSPSVERGARRSRRRVGAAGSAADDLQRQCEIAEQAETTSRSAVRKKPGRPRDLALEERRGESEERRDESITERGTGRKAAFTSYSSLMILSWRRRSRASSQARLPLRWMCSSILSLRLNGSPFVALRIMPRPSANMLVTLGSSVTNLGRNPFHPMYHWATSFSATPSCLSQSCSTCSHRGRNSVSSTASSCSGARKPPSSTPSALLSFATTQLRTPWRTLRS